MQLNELKQRLEIPTTDTTKDELLEIQLESAISEAQAYCNQDFKDTETGELVLPAAVKHAVAILVRGMNSNEAIQADSIAGGMSKTLIQGGYHAAAKRYMRMHRKVKVIM